MNLSELCIKRPVFATVISLIMITLGLLGFFYLDTRFMPTFEQHSISITTFYNGASAQLVENSITTPLEEAISGISGIDIIKSDSRQGFSSITVKIKPDEDLYSIANKIRNKVAVAQASLPGSVKSPEVKAGWDDMELLDIGFTSTSLSLNALRDYLDRYVINRIEQIPGIANVSVDGAKKYAMRIWLNPLTLKAYQLSVSEVRDAITNSNIQLPAGKIEGESINFPVTAQTQLSNVKQFANIIIKNSDDKLIRLRDLGRVELGSDNTDKSIVRINGKRGIQLTISNSTESNPILAAKQVVQLLAEIKHQLPSGIQAFTTFNQARFMQASVHEVYISIFLAILCVALIIYLFFGRARSAIIPIITIPICLITTLAIMYALGFSLNVITLLALVLSIGLVVDDAIVVLENIHRHMEAGLSRWHASIKGSKEITFPVIAMTLTLAAVYAPIGLMKGGAQHIFASFAFTLAGAVIISGFVALTLSPMMCARLLPATVERNNRLNKRVHHFFQILSSHYQRLLFRALRWRFLIILATLLIAVGGYFLFHAIPKDFMPQEDMGFMITVMTTPNGQTVEKTARSENAVTSLIRENPAVQSTLSFATQTSGFNLIFTTLKPYNERHISANALANDINKRIQNNPELNAFSFAPSFGNSGHYQLEFSIMGSSDYKQLYTVSQNLISELKKYPMLRQVKSNIEFNNQQYTLNVNRDLAGKIGVSVKTIDQTVADLLGGSAISTFNMGGRNYDVYLQAQDPFLHSARVFSQFYVKNNNAQLVSLDNIVNLTPTLTQPVLTHFNRSRSATISAQLAPNYALGTVVEYLNQQLPHLLPSDVKYSFMSGARRILQASNDVGLLFILAIVFIYLVLCAQFESFLDPLIILLGVPLSMVGAMFALKLTGGSLNIFTDIGLVTLIGLIAKHGILITQFANRLQERGISATHALVRSATIRLRPILMTTAAMVFGALPLLFSQGASQASRAQIGIVIIAGLVFGTFFSLIVVPMTYSYASSIKRWKKRRFNITELQESYHHD